MKMSSDFIEAFWGESGFELLRKYTRSSAEFFKDVINILEERAELELNYSKNLHKLSTKLIKASKTVLGTIDLSWKLVADEMDGESTVHKNFAVSLESDIVKPLKSVFEAQQKSRKTVENTVEKSLKRYTDRRGEQGKCKKRSHGLSQSCEKVEKTLSDEKRRTVRLRTDKQMAKLQSKCGKLEESANKANLTYHEATLAAERQRQDLETVLTSSALRFQHCEQARLANMQMALGRYQCHLAQLGPGLSQASQKLQKSTEAILTTDTRDDLKVIVAQCQPNNIAYRSLVMCDFYAEDFSNHMNQERRQQELQRYLVMFETDLQKEKKGKQGLESLAAIYDKNANFTDPESKSTVYGKLRDTTTMLMFLDYHLYKIQCSLCSVDTNAGRVKPSHPLARFEEKHKDKLGLRQTVVRIPLFEPTDFVLPDVVDNLGTIEERRCPDGQSPSHSSDDFDPDPVYETLEAASTIGYGSYISSTADGDNEESTCTALYDFLPQDQNQLKIKAGDIIRVKSKFTKDWWEGEINGRAGLFPSNYVEHGNVK